MSRSNTHSPSSSEDNTNSPPSSPHLSLATTVAAEATTSAVNLHLSEEQQGTVAPVSQAAAIATTTAPPPRPSLARGPQGVGIHISISEAGNEGIIRWRPSNSSSLWPATAAIPPTANPLLMSPNAITTATALLEQAFQPPPPQEPNSNKRQRGEMDVPSGPHQEPNSNKRQRGEMDVPSGPHQEPNSNKRQKGEMDVPSGPPVCAICSKRFQSWKAVFGHLRVHKERTYRGAFPPPVSSHDGSSSSSTIAITTTPRRRGLEIDLNIQFNPDEANDEDINVDHDQALTPPPPPALESESIDLNEPAAATKSDEKEHGDGSTTNNDKAK